MDDPVANSCTCVTCMTHVPALKKPHPEPPRPSGGAVITKAPDGRMMVDIVIRWPTKAAVAAAVLLSVSACDGMNFPRPGGGDGSGDALIAAGMGMMGRNSRPAPVTTTCTPFGRSVNCTTY